MQAISKLMEKLKAWAVQMSGGVILAGKLKMLSRWENGAWNELGKMDAAPNEADMSDVERALRVALLCQQNRMALQVGDLISAVGPQISALPGMLRSAIELSASKKPGAQAALSKFFDASNAETATAAGIDLMAALCTREEDLHPLAPEIRALRAESERVDSEISKLRDAGWHREELDGKRRRLALLQAERARRPEAEVQDTETLILVPHYRQQREQLRLVETAVASSAMFDALDHAIGELVVVTHLDEWWDGSPGSLDGLLKAIYRNPAFTALHNSGMDSGMDSDGVNINGLLAAVLNAHATARNAGPGIRFTLDPDNRVIGVWMLPPEVLEALDATK